MVCGISKRMTMVIPLEGTGKRDFVTAEAHDRLDQPDNYEKIKDILQVPASHRNICASLFVVELVPRCGQSSWYS